jgi:sugar lactone lactonase YvrE
MNSVKVLCLAIVFVAFLSQPAVASLQLLVPRSDSNDQNAGIRLYDGNTGTSLGTLVAPGPELNLPNGTAIGPDGQLYVSDHGGGVLKYDLAAGKYLQTFVPAGIGGLGSPSQIAFGPDGNLYVPSNNNEVLRFNGTTGAFIDVFATGLSLPQDLVFAPNGDLYVTSGFNNRINRYDGITGALIQSFGAPTLNVPTGIAIGSDHNLYVLSTINNRVLRFDPNGNYIDDFVMAGSGGLNDPQDMTIGPDGDLYVESSIQGVGFAVLQYNGKSGEFVGMFTRDLEAMGSPRGGLMFVDRNGPGPEPGTFLLGDFNRDGHVNYADVAVMLNFLTNMNAYKTALQYSDNELLLIGDLNGDDKVTNADLQSLLDLLKSGGGSLSTVPEPSSMALALVGLMTWGFRYPKNLALIGVRTVCSRF